MAYALTSFSTTVNSVDWSQWLNSSTLTLSAAELDSTDFASGGWVEVDAGLASGTLALNFVDSLTDNEIDELLWALFRTKPTFVVKPTSASVSANNPSYSGTILITGHSIGGGVGELATKSLTFPTSGAVSRAVS